MAVEFITAVWELSPYQAEKLLVHIAFADWANSDGEFWPSYAEIAERARVTKRGAIGIVDQMIEDGEIVLTTQGQGKGHTNQYKFSDTYLNAVAEIRNKWRKKRAEKGEPRSPLVDKEKVNVVHLNEGEKVNTVHLLENQKVNVATTKGERDCCAYKEEPSWNRQEEGPSEKQPPSSSSQEQTTDFDKIKLLIIEATGEVPVNGAALKIEKAAIAIQQAAGTQALSVLKEYLLEQCDKLIKLAFLPSDFCAWNAMRRRGQAKPQSASPSSSSQVVTAPDWYLQQRKKAIQK